MSIARGSADGHEQRALHDLTAVIRDAGKLVGHRAANVQQHSGSGQRITHDLRRKGRHRDW